MEATEITVLWASSEYGVYGTSSAGYAGYFQGKLKTTDDLYVKRKYYDSSDDAGTAGQVLSSTATGTNWIDPPTVSVPLQLIGSANPGAIIYANNQDYGCGIEGRQSTSQNVGRLGEYTYGVYGMHNSSGNFGKLGTATHGVYGETSTNWAVYGKNTSTGNYGTLASNGTGVYGRYESNGNYGTLGSSSYGVYGETSAGSGVYGKNTSTGDYGFLGSSGYGVYGYSSGGYAGYFQGNVYVTGNVSALSFTDRTPYPKDLQTAYEAVMSMEKLPDGQYEEDNKENQLDHSKLSRFIQSEDGNRDLSATVSCLNEVVKDLIEKVEAQQKCIETQTLQIQQLTEMTQRLQKEQ